MPLFYQQHINQHTKLAVWKIEETEQFFNQSIPINTEITHPHKRLQHYAGRFLLRYLFPNFPYEQILIANTKKPYLENEAYHFSISHCGDYAAAIVSSNNRVGIDVEIVAPRVLKIVPKFLNEKERNLFNLLNLENVIDEIVQQNKATLLWSIKESLFKWWGNGNVDFKEMLKIEKGEINKSGVLNTIIKSNNIDIILIAHYKQFDNLMLSYVVK